MTSNSSSTLSAPRPGPALAAAEPDPELLSLPAPPKRERTITVVLMVVTAVAAAWMALSLLGEARYAVTPGHPLDVGDLTALHPGEEMANRYVRATGLLASAGAVGVSAIGAPKPVGVPRSSRFCADELTARSLLASQA